MSNMNDALTFLEALSVRFRPKSHDTYDKVLNIAKAFEQLSPQERASFINQLSSDAAKKVLSFSAFFAEMAIATGESEWLRGAVLLHLIEDFRRDYRENYRYLALVAYSANQINARLNAIIQDLLPFSSSRSRAGLEDFMARDESLNDLEKFGVKCSTVDGQPRFVQM